MARSLAGHLTPTLARWAALATAPLNESDQFKDVVALSVGKQLIDPPNHG